MDSKKASVLIIAAPSGAGKTTLVGRALSTFPFFQFSISCTTRAPRGQEVDGKDYYFLSVEEFREKIEAGAFLESEEVYPGRYYGTLKSEITRIQQAGQIPIFDVDVVGALNLKQYFQEEALAIFIKPPSLEELRKRLVNRGTDAQAEIEKRLAKSEHEISFAPQFDQIIVNDDLEHASQELHDLIQFRLQPQNDSV
ncbi:guanylate kinase [Pontibacter sp. G13]|uniref:guanylate kinase n=1 Tax=Pontibacter sp. G13 TaxID=3074898 RepID=UPI00288AFE93|nr:guanylate kinase [Pontibacter sp. G13]WNJ16206.1 guanylate kinase [Pontibacter sp. G13]